MDNVVFLKPVTDFDLPPERILDGAKEASLKNVVVAGMDDEGALYLASSTSDMPTNLWLIEVAKTMLIRIGVDDEE